MREVRSRICVKEVKETCFEVKSEGKMRKCCSEHSSSIKTSRKGTMLSIIGFQPWDRVLICASTRYNGRVHPLELATRICLMAPESMLKGVAVYSYSSQSFRPSNYLSRRNCKTAFGRSSCRHKRQQQDIRPD